MPDYRRAIKFGYFLIPNAGDPLVSIAQEVERLGVDYVAVQDHPYQRRFVDTWTLLSTIAGATSRVGLFPDVADLPLRPPAVLAKATASLDVLSGGRFDLGLGAGAFWDAIEAFGGPRRSPGEALAALAEAIQVIRMVWSGGRNLRFEGQHYHLGGTGRACSCASDRNLAGGVWPTNACVPSFRGDLQELAVMTARAADLPGGGRPG
jgi:alkanesulfonate monooxygenase SsuD/methylene tetrahydromethanopterin reductase-like flavin-dependent oxidoreductase (luciferase family)